MKIANTVAINNLVENQNIKTIRSKMPEKGDIIEGKIINSSRSLVDVLLNNGEKIRANIQGNSSFNIGENVKFVVKSSDVSKLLIESLSGNSAEDKLVKVLENADVRVNEKNLQVVKALFEQNMPVNKQIVTKFARLSAKFPEVPPKMLISLQKSKLPLNEKNIQVLTEVIKGEQPLFKATKNLESVLKQVISTADNNLDDIIKNSEIKTKNDEISFDKSEKTEVKLKMDNQSKTALKTEQFIEKNTDNINVDKNFDIKDLFNSKSQTYNAKLSDFSNLKNLEKSLSKLFEFDNKGDDKSLKNILFKAINKDVSIGKLVEILDKKGVGREKIISVLKEVSSREQIDKDLYVKANKFSKEEVQKNVKSTVRLLQRASDEKMPDEVKDKAVKLVDTIKVMDKLSQDYSFIHVPIAFKDKKMNSEIYVRGKNKTKKDDKKSLKALLRLDLVNIGHIDIMISKKDKNIALTFYSEDELEDLKQSISVLRKEFMSSGYNLTECVYENNNGEDNLKSFFECNLDDEKQSVNFDMRA